MAESMIYGSGRSQLSNSRNNGRMLLWENADPTATFAAQTISLDLSAFDMIRIDFAWSTTYPQYLGTMEGYVGSIMSLQYKNFTSDEHSGREVSVTTSGVQFYGGYRGSTSNNNAAIPYRIWGIR